MDTSLRMRFQMIAVEEKMASTPNNGNVDKWNII